MNPAAPFAPRKTIEQVEEGHELAPKFDAAGPDHGRHHRLRQR